jgi:hypothetical protein
MSTTSLTERIVFVESDGNKTRKSHNKPARIATRTQWSLDDILKIAKTTRGEMASVVKWIDCERMIAKGHYDAQRLDRLGEMSRVICSMALHVAELERLAADARIGVYEPAQSK